MDSFWNWKYILHGKVMNKFFTILQEKWEPKKKKKKGIEMGQTELNW